MTDHEQTAYIPIWPIGNGEGVREERPALDINTRHALLAQWIEQHISNVWLLVRFQHGAQAEREPPFGELETTTHERGTDATAA